MRIYIASSWKNQHAVEMLTHHLRYQGHEVLSFVENENGFGNSEKTATQGVTFQQWIHSEAGTNSFNYDTNGATKSDLVVYISPSGCDAWAEVGAAWASNAIVWGLMAKGEQVGLMRRMVSSWFEDWKSLLKAVVELQRLKTL